MTVEYSELTRRFEAHNIDASTFDHECHVRVAYELLHMYEFLDASYRYATAISAIASQAGVPDKFNITITLAFLSLIAERIHMTDTNCYDEFLAKNMDLLSRQALSEWYSDEQLASDFARTHFVLPRMSA